MLRALKKFLFGEVIHREFVHDTPMIHTIWHYREVNGKVEIDTRGGDN